MCTIAVKINILCVGIHSMHETMWDVRGDTRL